MIPGQVPEDAPVFVISVAAQLAGMHPQTLRTYDRLGLVNPNRTAGGGRRYSARDIMLLREIARLSAEGVNLAGIKRIIELTRQTEILEAQVAALVDEVTTLRSALAGDAGYRDSEGRALVPMGNALMVWRPRRPPGTR